MNRFESFKRVKVKKKKKKLGEGTLKYLIKTEFVFVQPQLKLNVWKIQMDFPGRQKITSAAIRLIMRTGDIKSEVKCTTIT